ncbi:5-dehydro-2-deoxygluconokinase (plasmid) [Azospirillum sp. B510]|uniref:bifunctional 5-dehydro-2-deoxygluconokinase/5-dehydro-2- deoxyphosphogluconate aldolase n=1 Tax=Azospirillum sp. (strain B510) TaxID=137722 RepID=UPI0001C4CAA2|nr:5-dehydro-2-deoxygluconokinase [Azospirillum sp. B510]BAI74769.1 5-dehydro-2-deoxygluconokinase [Azospirillum sp. B510]
MPDQYTLDVIAIGRSSVDLYGEQVGGRLEDMQSFAKYVGGCPTNIAVGTARLGLRSALLTRVGDEHMGRFIREQLTREGVDTSHVIADPDRLTALVILGIRDRKTFPLIFYRENCADMALCEGDFGESFIASARAVVVTGTHFSTPGTDAAMRKAIRIARKAGTRVVLDIDYRPVLWRLTGHGLGEERFVADGGVTAHLQTILPDCDLIVGTEEEFHIAGGSTDTIAALRAVRSLTKATLVCKRGPMGCVVFPGDVPDSLELGVRGPGFPVEVFNVLGAGDAFMSGFLRGWLRNQSLEDCCAYANACGAFAVSRHGCAPAIPTLAELSFFLANGSATSRLRHDAKLSHIHWATTRRRQWPEVLAFAIDHRLQLEEMAGQCGAAPERIAAFKRIALAAARSVTEGRDGFGMLLDGIHGQDALDLLTGGDAWIGRPIEQPGSRPLRFEGGSDPAVTIREWPAEHVVKCLVFYHPDDEPSLREEQERQVQILFAACRATGHELLLELIPPKGVAVDEDTLARAMARFYGLGVLPDWWKVPAPGSQAAWDQVSGVIAVEDPLCHGVLILGLDAPEDEVKAGLALAARQPVCKGFAIGRTLFGPAAEAWLAGRLGDAEAERLMAGAYARLIDFWDEQRAAGRRAAA